MNLKQFLESVGVELSACKEAFDGAKYCLIFNENILDEQLEHVWDFMTVVAPEGGFATISETALGHGVTWMYTLPLTGDVYEAYSRYMYEYYENLKLNAIVRAHERRKVHKNCPLNVWTAYLNPEDINNTEE